MFHVIFSSPSCSTYVYICGVYYQVRLWTPQLLVLVRSLVARTTSISSISTCHGVVPLLRTTPSPMMTLGKEMSIGDWSNQEGSDDRYPVEAIQTLTYKLAFLYYNFPGGIRLPAPAQYAKKLAHLMGTAVFQGESSSPSESHHVDALYLSAPSEAEGDPFLPLVGPAG